MSESLIHRAYAIRQKQQLDLDLALEALAHLICSDRDLSGTPTKAHAAYHGVSAGHFDGFELLPRAEDGDCDDFILQGDNAADLPIWPLDVAVGSIAPLDLEWETGSWQFLRVRTLDMKQWRGKLSLFSPRMVEHAELHSEPNGRHVTVVLPIAIIGKQARKAGGPVNGLSFGGLGNYTPDPASYGGDSPQYDRQDNDHLTKVLRLIAGLSLRRYYLWSVLLGEGRGPRARFITDPIGVREAFRLRDIPPGKKRRQALLHWVKAHWRKSRSLSADDRAWVHAYLRGAWSYNWNGLLCQIEPSMEDMALLTGAQNAGQMSV